MTQYFFSPLLCWLGSSRITAYFQPGDPPQCRNNTYACTFTLTSDETGLPAAYTWDLRQLCQGAGREYIARRDPTCVVDAVTGVCPSRCPECGDLNTAIRFNICGTVSGPIAPVSEGAFPLGVGAPQTMPLPASHGVAVQYVDGWPQATTTPADYGPPGGCSDMDTCDQQYNPTCLPGSPNYPTPNAAVPATDSLYAGRAARCAANGLGYCSPYNYWCCAVKTTPCTKSAEILAVYDVR